MDYNSSNNELTEKLLNTESNSPELKKTKNFDFKRENNKTIKTNKNIETQENNKDKLAIKEWNNSIEDLLKSWGVGMVISDIQ